MTIRKRKKQHIKMIKMITIRKIYTKKWKIKWVEIKCGISVRYLLNLKNCY